MPHWATGPLHDVDGMAGTTDTVLPPRGHLGPVGRRSAVLACIPGPPHVASSHTRLLLPFPVPHCRRLVSTVHVLPRSRPESPSQPTISKEATLPQVVLPVLWAGLCPSPEAHINLQTSERGCIRGRAFADMIRPRSSMTGVLVGRDQDTDTQRDPCGPCEDPGRRLPSTWPGEASGGTGPATPGWGASSLQDARARSNV